MGIPKLEGGDFGRYSPSRIGAHRRHEPISIRTLDTFGLLAAAEKETFEYELPHLLIYLGGTRVHLS